MLTMQIRFRPVFVALASLFAVDAALAQAPAPRPAAKPAAPAAAAPAPAPAPDDAAPGSDTAPSEPADGLPEPAEPGGAEPAPAAEPPAGAPGTHPPKGRINPLPAFPEPSADANALQQMGQERPAPARPKQDTDVFADDWWSHARPILEIHGNFRVRGEMFYRFSLGRVDPPDTALWPRPPDAPYYSYPKGQVGTDTLCTAKEADVGSNDDPSHLDFACKNNTQTGANLRFRLNPEIHISDNLRVVSQIDLLDNIVMGSTPSGYSMQPGSSGYAPGARSDYEPQSFADQSTSPPRSGINSLSDSVHVKRVWGEYSTPVGELRFGRMPNHWGLGMVNNSGDGYDDDYQSTIDRVQFVFGVKPLDLFLSAALDFPNEGPTSEVLPNSGAQPYDLAKLDDVNQYVGSIARKKSFELTKLALTRGEVVVNGGVQLTYRDQLLSADCGVESSLCADPTSVPSYGIRYSRRDAHYWLPDLWVQVLYGQFRFEAEAATIQGSTHNARNATSYDTTKYDFASWGFATEFEQRLVENRLHLGMNFGWAQGDADVDGLEPGNNPNTFGQLGGDHTISTFRFNPAYRVDMILFRNILTRVQGAYYFRPSLGYDFIRDLTGQRLGGQIAGIWSRASEFMQSPGHDHDLGIELNGALYFQSKDGALNDEPANMGGFYARLEYGILFTLSGLGYPSGTVQSIRNQPGAGDGSTSNAQILRLHLGVTF
jgi:uncharacterized protein (TIGR04551 family)